MAPRTLPLGLQACATAIRTATYIQAMAMINNMGCIVSDRDVAAASVCHSLSRSGNKAVPEWKHACSPCVVSCRVARWHRSCWAVPVRQAQHRKRGDSWLSRHGRARREAELVLLPQINQRHPPQPVAASQNLPSRRHRHADVVSHPPVLLRRAPSKRLLSQAIRQRLPGRSINWHRRSGPVLGRPCKSWSS